MLFVNLNLFFVLVDCCFDIVVLLSLWLTLCYCWERWLWTDFSQINSRNFAWVPEWGVPSLKSLSTREILGVIPAEWRQTQEVGVNLIGVEKLVDWTWDRGEEWEELWLVDLIWWIIFWTVGDPCPSRTFKNNGARQTHKNLQSTED